MDLKKDTTMSLFKKIISQAMNCPCKSIPFFLRKYILKS